jgi:hypothetical protein
VVHYRRTCYIQTSIVILSKITWCQHTSTKVLEEEPGVYTQDLDFHRNTRSFTTDNRILLSKKIVQKYETRILYSVYFCRKSNFLDNIIEGNERSETFYFICTFPNLHISRYFLAYRYQPNRSHIFITQKTTTSTPYWSGESRASSIYCFQLSRLHFKTETESSLRNVVF